MFGSDKMTMQVQGVVSMAMLTAFIVSGAVNALIAVTGSLYLHQWSLFMIPVVVIERFTAGALVSVVFGALGGVMTALVEWNPWMGFLFFTYCVGFTLFLMLVAAVLTLEKGHNLKKIGGRTVMWCLPILFAGPVVMLLDISLPATPVYITTMLLCLAWMLYRFKVISHKQATRYTPLTVTTDEDVMNWYDPTFLSSEPPPSALMKVKETRLARHAFQIAVAKARRVLFMKRDGGTTAGGGASGDNTSLVQRRAALYEKELDLLTWFCMMRAQPVPVPWSSEWDRIVGQGLDAMWMQGHSMARIRGSLLWVRESCQCGFGAVYFALIFVDRLVRACTGAGAFLFLPTASRYSTGVSWATLYFIIVSGSLELVLAAMGERASVVESIRIGLPSSEFAGKATPKERQAVEMTMDVFGVGEEHVERAKEKLARRVGLADVVVVQREADRAFFWAQLRRFVVWLVFGLALAGGAMWTFSRNAHRDAWIVFHAASVGYTGILFGTMGCGVVSVSHCCWYYVPV